MLGKDLFKVESNAELSNEKLKSLVLFYEPLIGYQALYLYEFLTIKGTSAGFEELNRLLNSLSFSINEFENQLRRLNKYKLIRTLKSNSEEKFIFVIENPLNCNDFVRNDIYSREFILKTSGEYFQSLILNLNQDTRHDNFSDVSVKLDPSVLNSWSKEKESYLNISKKKEYDFKTLFDINDFLKDVSLNLLPLKFRNEDNLKEIAMLADLYNVSPEKMRTFLPLVARSDSDNFDLKLLRNKCMSLRCEYRDVPRDKYDVPCELFLMNKQNGKELTGFDKKLIYNLASEYHLTVPTINALLEYALDSSDNHLYASYIYSIASDLNRNDIKTAQGVKERLNRNTGGRNSIKKQEGVPVYDASDNLSVDSSKIDEMLRNRDKQ